MTNREWLDRMSNYSLAELFCEKVAQDGDYCKKCPFKDYCVDGENGFENFLKEEHKENVERNY